MTRILIVNQNWVGDVLCSTPTIRAIRKAHPKAHIACLAPERVMPVLRHNPHLDEILPYDDRAPFISWGSLKLIGLLKARHFDKAIFFHRSKTKVLWAAFAGIPDRAGYSVSSRWLTTAVPVPRQRLHKVDYFLHLVEALGIPADGRALDFYPAPAAFDELTGLLTEHGVMSMENAVVVHAGGNWDLKRWPVEYFKKWIESFLQEFPGPVILCGTKGETKLVDSIVSHFENPRVVSLCGETSLDTLGALLKKVKLILSNDSGPIHLAASQSTPIVGLYGPTSHEETGPVGNGPIVVLRKDVGCEIPCYFRSCNYRVCMDWIKPEEAMRAARELLNRPVK
ncbi:MAG: lipopolysaccharide heptosyltransferase II [Candidatus Omnitrophica bacterium]|nr:lipopolysaccharide heptosyltransferase II [Candidatus Omnitrophota bacterium]